MGGTANLNAPQGTVLNPAVSAGKQRVTLDLSYLALTGVNPLNWSGNFINGGITIPSAAGVFSATGRFANANFSGAPNWGGMGGVTAVFREGPLSRICTWARVSDSSSAATGDSALISASSIFPGTLPF